MFVACASSQVASWDREQEELAVYAAVVDTMFPPRLNNRTLVVSQTRSNVDREHLVEAYWSSLAAVPGVERSAVADFEQADRTPRKINVLPSHSGTNELIEDSVLTNLPRGYATPPGREPSNYWRAFRARFPGAGGMVSFTRVGFSDNRRQALVEVSRSCGSLCGGGYNVLLEKQNGRWRVVQQINTWVS
jgi:hypothetical protein